MLYVDRTEVSLLSECRYEEDVECRAFCSAVADGAE